MSSRQENVDTGNISTEDVDYEFVDTIRIYYPALYQKDCKEYSDRDIRKNSWIGLCKRMGIANVELAKQWWTRLLNEYRIENDHRVQERRSGSAASIKREHFQLRDLMKDMLSRSQVSRPTTSNYQSNAVRNECNDSEEKVEPKPQQQYSHNSQCYNSSKASGRRGRKKFQLATTLQEINETVNGVQSAMDMRKQEDVDHDADGNVNKDIGDLIFSELQKMETSKADEKRKALLAFLHE